MAQSTVRLIVDASNAINPLKRVNETTKKLANNTNKLKDRLNKSNRSLRDSGTAAKRASGGFATLNRTLGPLLKALAVAAAARFVFVQSAELETQRKSLEVLTGSLKDTNKIIKELQDFGAVTPFTSSELIEQTKRLKAFGFETEELVDTTKRLSDVAGATGADLSGIATAFGQIRAKGKLQQEENLQLLERGVDITTELQRITKLQGEEFADAVSKGKIGADLVNQALINLTNEGGAFFKGASAQATTLNGKLSTLVDSIQTLARTIGENLGDEIKFVLDLLTEGVKRIDNFIKRIGNIKKIGLGGVVNAEMQARDQALRVTKSKFGEDVDLGFFGDREAKKFFNEQRKLFEKQIINREKLKKISFQENNVLKDSAKQTKTINKETKETALALGTAFTNTDFLNESLGMTNIFTNSISNQVGSFSDALVMATSDADKLKETFMEIGRGIEDGIVSGLTDAVMGTKSLAEVAISVLNDLKRKLVEVAMQRAVSGIGNFFGNALSGILGGGGGGGLLGTFMPSLGGAGFSGGGGGISPLLGFANGGRPPVGRASVVGERGPELFVPTTSGTIVPNNKLGGGNTNIINVSVDASGTQAEGDEATSSQLGKLIGLAVQQELVKQSRAGGLLSRA